MDSSSDDEYFLMDSVFSKLKWPKRRCKVHNINKERAALGEYHHLFIQLKSYPDRFYAYTRMNLDTFSIRLSTVWRSLGATGTGLFFQRSGLL
ncbi:hypothetical protein PoB_003457500 [Plakobranchus ocellatus]|uniref:Uncharacterized protein n=1 Tax=Plakobranchus ocellatus TaxID=259542 RepID=A0AAV4AMF5_9GAST|nr:hypothetical protein PoB_003457500 [Plakobranchus ocellatus]